MTLQKAVCEIARRRSLQRYMGIVEALADQFGGADGVAREWVRVFRKSKADKRYRRTCDMMIAMMELQSMAEKAKGECQQTHRANAPDATVQAESVRDSPDLAAAALQQLGWTVEPPGP